MKGLRCYQDNDISWLNPQYPQCALSTGMQELNATQGFSIAPSSVRTGQPFIINLDPGMNDAHVRILDASGRIVIDRGIHGSGTFTLQQAGIYLVRSANAGSPIAPQQLIVQ